MMWKKAFLMAAFAVNGLGLCAQTEQSQEQSKPSYHPHLQYQPAKTEVLILLGCRHSDRKTPYREINPGLLFLTHVTESTSIERGGYFNSNYGFSTTSGMVAEVRTPIGQHFYGTVGVMMGIALYSPKEKNECIVRRYLKNPFDDAPQNVSERGHRVTYNQVDSNNWFVVDETRHPRGKGLQRPRAMIMALASFMHNSGNGVFGVFAVGPGLGTNGQAGTLAAGGFRFNTDPAYNYIMR